MPPAAVRSRFLDNENSIFLEGFSMPQQNSPCMDWDEFDGALQMVQEALNVKSAALEKASSELNQLKQQFTCAQLSMAEMRRAELDSGSLRDEVETLMSAKYSLLRDFAELERKARMLWQERELICEQLEVDPSDDHTLFAVLESKLAEARRCEALELELASIQMETLRLEEELGAARANHKRSRAVWQKQERMLMKALTNQLQLASRPCITPPTTKRSSPSHVKYITQPYPHLQISPQQLHSLQSPNLPTPPMPRTPPGVIPAPPHHATPSLSAVELALEALELGSTPSPARIQSAPITTSSHTHLAAAQAD